MIPRQSITVTSRTTGTMVDGVYSDGASTTRVIQSSVQPAKNNDVLTLPEGRRESKAYKLYTEADLVSLQQSQNPDQVTLFGEQYEVITKNIWANAIIPHIKYIVVKI